MCARDPPADRSGGHIRTRLSVRPFGPNLWDVFHANGRRRPGWPADCPTTKDVGRAKSPLDARSRISNLVVFENTCFPSSFNRWSTQNREDRTFDPRIYFEASPLNRLPAATSTAASHSPAGHKEKNRQLCLHSGPARPTMTALSNGTGTNPQMRAGRSPAFRARHRREVMVDERFDQRLSDRGVHHPEMVGTERRCQPPGGLSPRSRCRQAHRGSKRSTQVTPLRGAPPGGPTPPA